MGTLHRGRQSIVFDRRPAILSAAAIGGKKEREGPLAAYFDETTADTTFRQLSWEKAESKMQALALESAKRKAGLHDADLDALFSGDLLNQCISSSFAVRDTGVPFFGLYGACSTMAEALILSGMAVNGGYARIAAAMSSSHFASAELQYRFPLGHGGQRTPTAQWTVTGAGCMLLGLRDGGPCLRCATVGTVVDYGIKDAANMGAAMAPAAYETLRAHFRDTGRSPADYDLVLTGDLGQLGWEIVSDFFSRDGCPLSNYNDCGLLLFDRKRQDMHCGASGCGCSASVFNGYLLQQLESGTWKTLLFAPTGALLSPTSSFQGESIPGICHAVCVEVLS